MDTHPSTGDPDAYEDLKKAGRKDSILGKVNQRFQDALQTGRGDDRIRDIPMESENSPNVTADDLAMRRAKSVKPQRMIVPEGVIIEGALSSGSETEIEGRVDGDVTVDGQLYLGKSALVSGNVRATNCKLEGLVEGKMDCAQEFQLGRTGRLNADAVAGHKATLAGQVNGNVTCGGALIMAPGAEVNGKLRARVFILEEGAVFNGECQIGPSPKQPAK